MRGDRAALYEMNLEIACGEHVCILGPNGCGKSTLIKTITRECYPLTREGSRISILGRERWDIFELRSLLGIVSPDLLGSLHHGCDRPRCCALRIFQQHAHFPHHHPDPEHLLRTEETLARLALHICRSRVAEMSSGEAKRTLIARALVHQPQTLLFDEPSNALDIGAQIQLRRTMSELAQFRAGDSAGHPSCIRDHPGDRARDSFARRQILATAPNLQSSRKEHLSKLFGVPIRLGKQGGFFHLY